MAELHPQLAADCFVVGSFSLSRLLLMDDMTYPWFILVPDRERVTELHELEEADQQQLMRESVLLSHTLADCFCADKINVAALGNIVPQLHIHHIVRYRTDPAWPAPIWGKLPRQPYTTERRTKVSELVSRRLAGSLVPSQEA